MEWNSWRVVKQKKVIPEAIRVGLGYHLSQTPSMSTFTHYLLPVPSTTRSTPLYPPISTVSVLRVAALCCYVLTKRWPYRSIQGANPLRLSLSAEARPPWTRHYPADCSNRCTVAPRNHTMDFVPRAHCPKWKFAGHWRGLRAMAWHGVRRAKWGSADIACQGGRGKTLTNVSWRRRQMGAAPPQGKLRDCLLSAYWLNQLNAHTPGTAVS